MRRRARPFGVSKKYGEEVEKLMAMQGHDFTSRSPACLSPNFRPEEYEVQNVRINSNVYFLYAVDGSVSRLQLWQQLLKKGESNGTDQDSWIGYREDGFPLGVET